MASAVGAKTVVPPSLLTATYSSSHPRSHAVPPPGLQPGQVTRLGTGEGEPRHGSTGHEQEFSLIQFVISPGMSASLDVTRTFMDVEFRRASQRWVCG